MTSRSDPAVVFDHVSLAFDEQVVLQDISFTVPERFTQVILGASGSGKSLILKLMLGLVKPDRGAIFVHGQRIDTMAEDELRVVRRDIGMLFQESALFDSLTVGDNVGYGLIETAHLPLPQVQQRVEEVLGLLGLGEYIDRLPSELSGGQRRRVAVGRAMAGRPSLLLFDEPTSGLDPITATTVDDEIVKSRDLGEATSVVVTHQVRDALYIATRTALRRDGGTAIVPAPVLETHASFMMLRDSGICFSGSPAALIASPDPYVQAFVGAAAYDAAIAARRPSDLTVSTGQGAWRTT